MFAMAQSRRIKLAFTAFITAFLIVAIGLIVVLNFDWNRARPWLNARASSALGRPVAIRGSLTIHWEKAWQARAGADATPGKTWRDFILWPHLEASDVHVGNPANMLTAVRNQAPELASISQFSFSLDPLALLDKKIIIPVLRFKNPLVELQRNGEGTNNWTFENHPSDWNVTIQHLVLTKGTVHLMDAVNHADVTADIDTISIETHSGYGVAWSLRGNYHGDRVKGSGKAGAVLSLQQQITPYPVAASMTVGSTSLSIAGTLTKPSALTALDLRLKVSGASMARLFPLTGLVLPETPHFSTEGHLLGILRPQHSNWIYENFSGSVGASDIHGTLQYQSQRPRPLLTGSVISHQLYLNDLGPLIGADSNKSKAARGVAPIQPAGKVLPVEPFKTERWTSIDADVLYRADKIVRDKSLPISKLDTHLIMKGGVLSLNPLNFILAGGVLKSNIELDGSGRINGKAIRAEMKTSALHLKIKQLFPTLPDLQASVGEINGTAMLSSSGNSVAGMLGIANGEVKTQINQGTVSKLLLEKMGLNIGSVILTRIFGDKQVKLNCMASDFIVQNGVMQTRTFFIDTEDAFINVAGNINLAQEKLDLTLHPDSKGVRVLSLRAPLYVRGSFDNPAVSVDKKVLAMRAGGALALAAVAPLAAMIPLIHAGPGTSRDCSSLLAAARIKPGAPPPGKRMGSVPAQTDQP